MNDRNFVKGIKFKRPGALDARAIADVVEQGYLNMRRSSGFMQKVTFSPSTVGYGHGTCPRYWFHAFTGAWFNEDRTDAMGVGNMDTGTHEHATMEKIFEDAGMLEANEVEIKIEDPPIRGYVDAIIDWEGERVVGEFKTTRQEAFVFRELSGKPAPYHLLQLLTYLRALDIPRGFLLYLNKNDQTVCVIPVEMNETNTKILDDVFAWLRTTRAAWENDTLPERPFRKSKETGLPDNKICNSCPVQKACQEAPEGVIKIARMELPKL
jgi:CRISPR/Cas system-associated exonuclease Cas4 (RecB family)